jgi:hypothetical protein
MMAQYADSSTVFLHGNGVASGTAESTDFQERFFEQAIQLYKDVIAGTHPRLRLPTADSYQPTPASLAQPSQPVDFSSTAASSSTPQHRLRPVLDPILLEKSPHLIKAEQELAQRRNGLKAKLQNYSSGQRQQVDPVQKRQQEIAIQRSKLEKALGLQVQMLSGSDAMPLLVHIPLDQALHAVAPQSGLKTPPAAQSPSSESFDENSYYSSKADSWSTEHTVPHGYQNDSDAMVVSDEEEEEEEDLYEPPPQVEAPSGPLHNHHATLPGIGEPQSQQDWEPEWDDDEEDDDGEDYEPPAPMPIDPPRQNTYIMPPQPIQNTFSAHHNLNHHVSAPQQSTHRPGRHPGGPTIIENRIRSPVSIVVNQIQSPAAPQPSRISPLAFGRMMPSAPPAFNGQRQPPSGLVNTSSSMASRRNSPTGGRHSIQMKKKQDKLAMREKKRKRNATPEERQTRKSKKGKRRAITPLERQPRRHSPMRSPEPYIKPEPVSPQPYYSHMGSPRMARPQSAYQSDFEASPRAYVPRRAPDRDTQDLRRVASLHYARRPISPAQAREYEYGGYVPTESRVFTPAPYEVVDRRSRASAYPEGYPPDPYARVHSPSLMAPPPPPRQIIMDQYGNKYYAEPVVEHRHVYERAVTRAPIPRYDDSYQAMPPPPRIRSYTQMPEDVVERPRAYSVRPQESSQRDASRDYHHVPQQRPPPPRFEEHPAPQRAYSVRPEPPRHQEYRHPSQQPEEQGRASYGDGRRIISYGY